MGQLSQVKPNEQLRFLARENFFPDVIHVSIALC